MQDNRILSTLKSSNATLAVLVLALVAQMPHAADVFRLIVHSNGIPAIAHSYAFAIALELAVLLFVVQSRHTESYAFAAVSIAMNLSYYYLHDVQLVTFAAMPALLVSVALPVAIARYSHAVADVHPMQEEIARDAKPARQERQSDVQKNAKPNARIDNDDAPIVQPDKLQRALQMKSEGLNNALIGKEIGMNRNQVGDLLRSANGHSKAVQA